MAIVGPNGAGKSTLLKAILGLTTVAHGYARVYGEPIERRRAAVAYVPQREEVDWDFPISVLDVVLMGCYGALPFYRTIRAEHRERARAALNSMEMLSFAERQISQLSGGQQQRVFIARALAQDASIYFLDEPFAGIDAATETALVTLFARLQAQGKTVVCVHHDLDTIRTYFDWAILVNQRLIAAGPVSVVVTAENLQATYGGRLGLLSEIAEKLGRGPE